MSGTLPLAALIASMDHAALSHLIASRRVISPVSVAEPLGLAIELLRADSIARALQSAHRDSLSALFDMSEGRDADPAILNELAELGLVGLKNEATTSPGGSKFTALPEVSEALPTLELETHETHETHTQDPAKPADLSGWFASGLTSVRRVAKLLHTIAAHPVKLGRKGRPAVVAVRDLAEAAHCTPEQSAHLLDLMRAAGLLAPHRDRPGAEQLRVTDLATQHWLMQLDYPERWIELARAAVSRIDARVRRGIEESSGSLRVFAERLPHDYPLLPEADIESIISVVETAEELGLTVHGRLTPAAEALLLGDDSTALELAVHDIPTAASGVYLQPDLSIIVPGPLRPEDEAILNSIAETEQLGPAASMRISTERLSSAVLRAGSSTQVIRDALERLSLTGIPQPLDYLLRDLDRRSFEYSSGDENTSQSVYLAAQNAADPGPFPPASARVTEPQGNLGQSKPAPSNEDELQRMIERVFTAARDAGSEGDLTRRLELAIRDRSPVLVTAVAGKEEREFTLLPVSLKAGRLRATDQVAGVERTLPVSAITAVAAI